MREQITLKPVICGITKHKDASRRLVSNGWGDLGKVGGARVVNPIVHRLMCNALDQSRWTCHLLPYVFVHRPIFCK